MELWLSHQEHQSLGKFPKLLQFDASKQCNCYNQASQSLWMTCLIAEADMHS